MITARTPAGNTSAGIAAPENKSIGKYSRLVAMFMDFVVRQRLAAMRPMENMESMVRSHTAMNTNTFPAIRYPKMTAAAVRSSVETAAIMLLAMVSQASSRAGEQGLQ